MKTLTPRLHDKIPNIRVWAIKALYKFQNPDDIYDPIVTELLNLMKNDSSKDVRLAAVEALYIGKRTVVSIVDRVKDVHSDVRVGTINHLANKIDVRHINAQSRATIVRYGLNDRDPAVLRAAKDMILKWLDRNALNNNVPKLLNLLNLQQNEDEAELLGLTIIQEVERDENSSISLKQAIKDHVPDWSAGFTSVSASEILWVLLRCEYAQANSSPAVSSDVKDALLPDIVNLCELLAQAQQCKISENQQYQLSVKYLLRMTAFLEASDVSGSEELIKVSKNLLKDVYLHESLVFPAIHSWWRGSGVSSEDFITQVLEYAQNLVEQFDDSSDDMVLKSLTTARSLLMIEWALERGLDGSVSTRNITSYEKSIPLILESLQQPFEELRGLSVVCLGLLSLFSEENCLDHKEILMQVARNDIEASIVRCQALKAIIDVATIYPDKFKNDTVFMNLLMHLHQCSDPTMLRVAVEGAAKLLFIGCLTEPNLFGNLVKFFFVSDLASKIGNNDEDGIQNEIYLGSPARLEQILCIFFQTFFAAGTGRETIILESVPLIVSDISTLMRRNDANSATMLKIVTHFLSIFESMKVASSNNDNNDNVENIPETSDISTFIGMRFMASISLQILKLGTKMVDKLVFKELVKVLGALNTDWIKPDIASTVARVIDSISEHSSEKANEKVFEKYSNICLSLLENIETELSEEVGPKGFEFLSLAPGLADLVDTEAKFVSKKTVTTTTTTNTTASTKSKGKSSKKAINIDDSDDSDDDNNNNDENENNNNDENAEVIRQASSTAKVSSSSTTTTSRPSRSAKAAASAKIVEQMEKITI